MTVKDAINLCDYLIDHYSKYAKNIRESTGDDNSDDSIISIRMQFAKNLVYVSDAISEIKSMIQPESNSDVDDD